MHYFPLLLMGSADKLCKHLEHTGGFGCVGHMRSAHPSLQGEPLKVQINHKYRWVQLSLLN